MTDPQSPASGPAGLTCRELVELVTDYLEGAMPAAERARFDAHLAQCGPCGYYVGQIERTVRTVGRLRETDLDPAAREALLATFRSWKRPTT